MVVVVVGGVVGGVGIVVVGVVVLVGGVGWCLFWL